MVNELTWRPFGCLFSFSQSGARFDTALDYDQVQLDKFLVQVVREGEAYDAFSFIVEIGSALGLWLGLSALDLYDIGVTWKRRIGTLLCAKKKK